MTAAIFPYIVTLDGQSKGQCGRYSHWGSTHLYQNDWNVVEDWWSGRGDAWNTCSDIGTGLWMYGHGYEYSK